MKCSALGSDVTADVRLFRTSPRVSASSGLGSELILCSSMPKPAGHRTPSKGSTVKSATGKPKTKRKGMAKPSLTAGQLFDRAQQALAFERYDAALDCMRDALQLEPENLDIITAHGALLAELGRTEEAVQELQQAVQLSPEEGFEKYMYLGQLLQGEEALAATQKGVELLQLDVERAKQSGESSNGLSKQLAAALCSLAEMKMSIAEDVSAVSAYAEALLQQASSTDPDSPEPLQALASLRYEQGQAEAALQLLKQSMSKWFRQQGSDDEDDEPEQGMEADAASEGGFKAPRKPKTMSEEEMDEDHSSSEDDYESDDEDYELPSFEFRFECAKLLLELDEATETVIQVLEELIAENDSVPDVWHLLGLSYYSGGMLTEAAEICQTGMQLLQKQQLGPEDDVTVSFLDLQSAIKEAQAVAGLPTA